MLRLLGGKPVRATQAAVALLAWALLAGADARAADPATGSVDPAAPSVEWTGSTTGYADLVYVNAGGTYGTCAAPHCDTFTLEVAGSGGAMPLTIAAETTTPAQEISIEVVQPGGETTFAGAFQGPQTQRTVTIPSAPDGSYSIHVSGGSLPGGPTGMEYKAGASLGAPTTGSCRALLSFPYESGGEPVAGGPTNDPLYRTLHGHRQMNVAAAWQRGGRGQGVTIAILDTGIDLTHPDLAANLVPGADLVEGKEGDCAPGPRDPHGHGTHVAGLAAAVAGNAIGVAGVAPLAKIMPVRVCATHSCDGRAINDGIRWAVDNGARVVNLSLGRDEFGAITGLAPLSALDESDNAAAVSYAVEHGAVVVASAGNSSWALCGHPAADPGAICVAAVDRDGLPTRYSNFPADRDADIDAFRVFGGDGSTCDTLAISTGWPGTGGNACGKAYQGHIGTSMASPQMAGAVAILLSFGIPAKDVAERLKATASNGGNYDPVMGYGIPDLDAATAGLRVTPPPPAAPSHAAPSPRPSKTSPSRSCRRAHATLRKAIRSAVRARRARSRRASSATRAAYKRALRKRDAAQRSVRRHCR